ncbi:hypothetical protein EVAR_47628_1 [Eumeta japonica]|uniref:Uncharacterized protein n=1 Tax=Eumeta variegata TaxID=151549 RepID=A0A4C1ZCU9_EUMVA|nr:hypothetical protein EVAR_47628_1 [Eumeta japonica]
MADGTHIKPLEVGRARRWAGGAGRAGGTRVADFRISIRRTPRPLRTATMPLTLIPYQITLVVAIKSRLRTLAPLGRRVTASGRSLHRDLRSCNKSSRESLLRGREREPVEASAPTLAFPLERTTNGMARSPTCNEHVGCLTGVRCVYLFRDHEESISEASYYVITSTISFSLPRLRECSRRRLLAFFGSSE